MKQTEQYANELIERYNKVMIGFALISIRNNSRFILLAIQDVENTIEALDKVQIVHRRYCLNGGGFGDDMLGKEITDPDINNDGRNYYAISNELDYYKNVLQILKDKLI